MLGQPPKYGAKRLLHYPADRAACAGYWIGRANQRFVPQAVAVRGGLAYVSGYQHHRSFAKNNCQIVVIDTRTGRTVAFVNKIQAAIYGPRQTYCRHGGGSQLTAEGLWIQETERLWLLDPAKIGHGDPVIRWWRIGRWTKGSAMVIDGPRLGVLSFRAGHGGRAYWFSRAQLLAPGVRDMTPAGGPGVHPIAEESIPRGVQGAAMRHGRVWFSTSGTGCGALIAPSGRRIAWVPGAEGIQFVGPSIWVVTEASARPYTSRHEHLVPMLLRMNTKRVLTGPAAGC